METLRNLTFIARKLVEGFLGSAQPASIYRNVCLSVCADYTKVVEVVLTTLRPGWRQVLLYKCTAAG
jgi:hypothetical protein